MAPELEEARAHREVGARRLELGEERQRVVREGRRHQIEYDGYEDSRVLLKGNGQLYLLANHEDCEGRRRLCRSRRRPSCYSSQQHVAACRRWPPPM